MGHLRGHSPAQPDTDTQGAGSRNSGSRAAPAGESHQPAATRRSSSREHGARPQRGKRARTAHRARAAPLRSWRHTWSSWAVYLYPGSVLRHALSTRRGSGARDKPGTQGGRRRARKAQPQRAERAPRSNPAHRSAWGCKPFWQGAVTRRRSRWGRRGGGRRAAGEGCGGGVPAT